MSWRQILLLILGVVAMFAVVPLMVWGGTGNWRRALLALRQYLGVIGLLLAAGGGLGLIMVAAERIG